MRPEHFDTKAMTRECKTKTETKNYETETGMIKVKQIGINCYLMSLM